MADRQTMGKSERFSVWSNARKFSKSYKGWSTGKDKRKFFFILLNEGALYTAELYDRRGAALLLYPDHSGQPDHGGGPSPDAADAQLRLW